MDKEEGHACDKMTDLEFFKQTRDQIKHEDNLINNRVTWLIAVQAFLFAAYGFAFSSQSTAIASIVKEANLSKEGLQQFSKIIAEVCKADSSPVEFISSVEYAKETLAAIGVLSAGLIMWGIVAAAKSMGDLVDGWERGPGKRCAENYPQIIGRGVPPQGIIAGLVPPFALPISFCIMWIYLEKAKPLILVAGGIVLLLIFMSLVGAWAALSALKQLRK